mgnify:CR=1 FL=1
MKKNDFKKLIKELKTTDFGNLYDEGQLKIEITDTECGSYIYGTYAFDEIDYFIECLSIDEYLSNDEKKCGRIFCYMLSIKIYLVTEKETKILYSLS